MRAHSSGAGQIAPALLALLFLGGAAAYLLAIGLASAPPAPPVAPARGLGGAARTVDLPTWGAGEAVQVPAAAVVLEEGGGPGGCASSESALSPDVLLIADNNAGARPGGGARVEGCKPALCAVRVTTPNGPAIIWQPCQWCPTVYHI